MNCETFNKQKDSCLSGLDLSRKGSIDIPIVDLVTLINNQSNYFTTSSCSGRVIVFEQVSGDRVKKQGCKWLYTSHAIATHKDVLNSISGQGGDTVLKFEPLVLHIQCQSLDDAQRLLACAVASGFRNSGISIGSKGKLITAVRSTHSLEVPLSQGNKLMVTDEYVNFLVDCANVKMSENFTRIERFTENFKRMLSKADSVKSRRKPRTMKDEHEVMSDTTSCRHEVMSDTTSCRHEVMSDTTSCRHEVMSDTTSFRHAVMSDTTSCRHEVMSDTTSCRQTRQHGDTACKQTTQQVDDLEDIADTFLFDDT